MGRPYSNELALLGATYEWAFSVDIRSLLDVLKYLREMPLIVVGSGGSLSACHLAARLHEHATRLPARVMTPLEFVEHPRPQLAGVLLLSAAGKNPDILTAARHAIASEYDEVLAVCARSRTKLAALLGTSKHATTLEFVGPSKKDGFLATNSLLQTCVLLARGYGAVLPAQLPALVDLTLVERDEALIEALGRPHLIALAHGWSLAAAMDLESKCSEIGMGAVTLTDSRNFAHGRHFGLSRRKNDVSIVGFTVSDERRVPEVTLDQLGHVARVVRFATDLPGASGAIDLIARVIIAVGEVSRRQGVDAGRPRVPRFGRAMYHTTFERLLQPDTNSAAHNDAAWVARKVTPAVWGNASPELRLEWQEHLTSWRANAESSRIGGLVLDYDGTICESTERFTHPSADIGAALTRIVDEGMILGVASGRGDSIIKALRRVIAPHAWPHVAVGVYNGAIIFRLDADFDMPLAIDPAIAAVAATLTRSALLGRVANVRERPCQLTVHPRTPLPRGLLQRMVYEALDAANHLGRVTVAASGHSVDVVAVGVGKHRVVEYVTSEMAARGHSALGIMTIGDQGEFGGNDARLLSSPLGFSVDRVSSHLEFCWNVAPPGVKRSSALLTYLNQLERAASGGFRWNSLSRGAGGRSMGAHEDRRKSKAPPAAGRAKGRSAR